MHYQSQIAPLEGSAFVWTQTHGFHAVGGEDMREVASVRGQRRVVHAGESSWRDLRALLTLPVDAQALLARPAPRLDVSALQGALPPDGQQVLETLMRELGGPMADLLTGQNPPAPAAHKLTRVPRRVFVSRHGKALLAYEAAFAASSALGLNLPGVLRWVDVNTGAVLGEWASHRQLLEGPGEGVERLSSVQLGRARGLSWDGQRVLLHTDWPGHDEPALSLCQLSDGLPTVARWAGRVQWISPIETGWVAIELGESPACVWLDEQLKPVGHQPLPQGVQASSPAVTPDGRWLLLEGEKAAQVALLNRDTGDVRWFAPHPGALRNESARLAISDDGAWLATQANHAAVLTRVADGLSWPVGSLDIARVNVAGQAAVDVLQPALGFVGKVLCLAQGDRVTEVSLPPQGEAFSSLKAAEAAPALEAGTPLLHALQQARLEPQAARILPHASPALLLDTQPLEAAGWGLPGDAGAPALGASRMGGWPDLPVDEAWPAWQERPMAFLAQINLADAHAAQPDLRLPAHGLLLFFVGCEEDTYDTDEDPRQRYGMGMNLGTEAGSDAWRVVHITDLSQLERKVYQAEPLPELLDPHSVSWVLGGAPLPVEDSAAYGDLQRSLPEADFAAYNDLLEQLPNNEAELDQFMGHPAIIQSTPPEWLCELASHGQDPWSFPDDEAGLAQLDQRASQWGMLLQLDTNMSVMRLYFYAPREAMARGDFSGAWICAE